MHLWHTVARLLVWPIFGLRCSGRCHPLLTWPPHLCRFRWWWSFGLETGSFGRDDLGEVGPQSQPTLFKNLRIYPLVRMSVRHWGSTGTFDRLTTNHALPLSSVGIKIWSLTSDTYIMKYVRLLYIDDVSLYSWRIILMALFILSPIADTCKESTLKEKMCSERAFSRKSESQ